MSRQREWELNVSLEFSVPGATSCFYRYHGKDTLFTVPWSPFPGSKVVPSVRVSLTAGERDTKSESALTSGLSLSPAVRLGIKWKEKSCFFAFIGGKKSFLTYLYRLHASSYVVESPPSRSTGMRYLSSLWGIQTLKSPGLCGKRRMGIQSEKGECNWGSLFMLGYFWGNSGIIRVISADTHSRWRSGSLGNERRNARNLKFKDRVVIFSDIFALFWRYFQVFQIFLGLNGNLVSLNL